MIGLALFAHTYLLAYALAAPVGFLFVLNWRRVPWRSFGVGSAIFAILMLIYGIGLANQWADTTRRAEQFTSDEDRLPSEAFKHALRLVTGSIMPEHAA
jgi:hypothetical protein